MKILKVEPLTDAGNVRALVQIETPDGETITCRIIKQAGFRAYLDTPPGFVLTHKQKRHLQREAVTAWADQIGDTLEGLLLSEKVFKGSRFHRLGVQLKAFCSVCDKNTPTEISETPGGHFRNSCYFCGTLRKGRPHISRAEAEQICEKTYLINTNAAKAQGETMKPKPFDFEQAAKLENYVRGKSYRQHLSNSALHIYFSLAHLERQQLGLCAPITANYKTLAKTAFLSAPKLKKPLQELNGILCEVEIGHPIKSGKIATRIRRYSLTDLMNGKTPRRLIDYEPPEALHLAELLNNRTFTYGANPACRPFWNVTRTGRVSSARPAVQNDPEKKRIESLCAGLQPGRVLISCDYKAADPTVLQTASGYHFTSDPYDLLADLNGTDRDSAKEKINMLAYAASAVAIVKHWIPEAQAAFTDYAEALDQYKEKLWQAGKPRNKQSRFVVSVPPSTSIHRGRRCRRVFAATFMMRVS